MQSTPAGSATKQRTRNCRRSTLAHLSRLPSRRERRETVAWSVSRWSWEKCSPPPLLASLSRAGLARTGVPRHLVRCSLLRVRVQRRRWARVWQPGPRRERDGACKHRGKARLSLSPYTLGQGAGRVYSFHLLSRRMLPLLDTSTARAVREPYLRGQRGAQQRSASRRDLLTRVPSSSYTQVRGLGGVD